MFMKNRLLFSLLFSGNYCMGQNQQGGHKPGKHGKLRKFEKLSESQGKLGENLEISQFLKKNLEHSGKM